MKSQNNLCVVQFIHPGKEHKMSKEEEKCGIKNWIPKNKRHERNFLKIKGKYINNPDDEEIKEDEIVFWGEWEAEAKKVTKISQSEQNFPEYIYHPLYIQKTNKDYSRLQDTDPFVFGNMFLYSICQQYRKDKKTNRYKPTLLRNLEKGSLILFGSCVNKKFVIDTVFVVKDYVDHNKDNYVEKIKEKLPEEVWEVYKEVTLSPIYQFKKTKDREYRLYIGATFKDKYEGMFSFFPCKPFKECAEGFKRPEIKINDIINPKLSQGFKKSCKNDLEKIKKIWDEVVKQVLKNGLKLGISAELPEKLKS